MKSVYELGLSVYPSVSARSNSRKCSTNILNFIDAIYICYRMEQIENVIYAVEGSSTGADKNFPISNIQIHGSKVCLIIDLKLQYIIMNRFILNL